jgi:hypothetical protein
LSQIIDAGNHGDAGKKSAQRAAQVRAVNGHSWRRSRNCGFHIKCGENLQRMTKGSAMGADEVLIQTDLVRV